MPKPDDPQAALRLMVQPWENNFREQMILRRKAQGINQTGLAKRLAAQQLSFHQQTIQRIESGERPIRLNEAILIAKELGASLQSMMVGAPPDTQKVMQAVHDVRGGMEYLPEQLFEVLDELETAGLIPTLHDLAERDGDSPSPELLYGLKWAIPLGRFAKLVTDAANIAAQVGGEQTGGAAPVYLVPPEFEWLLDQETKFADQLRSLPDFPDTPDADA